VATLQPSYAGDITIRVGYFPNVTHVHALVAQNLRRHGRDWFGDIVGEGVKLEWQVYNAGPTALRAMLAGALDLTYAGPYSVLNAYAATHGENVRIVAGAVDGGSALVVQPSSKLAKPSDFRGKRIATPEFENTQDVAARAWLAAGDVKIGPSDREVTLVPTRNADQLALFQLLQVDAVWTIEPWVSRLELIADGKILVEETDAITTVLASSVPFLKSQPDLALRFVTAHRQLTDWIGRNPVAAQKMVTEELLIRFKSQMSKVVLEHAWPRILVTNGVSLAALQSFVSRAKSAGYFQPTPDLSRLIEMP
jgi:NitT/TauT family transport system substrate-binding protein